MGGYRSKDIGLNLAIGKIGRLYVPAYNLKAVRLCNIDPEEA